MCEHSRKMCEHSRKTCEHSRKTCEHSRKTREHSRKTSDCEKTSQSTSSNVAKFLFKNIILRIFKDATYPRNFT